MGYQFFSLKVPTLNFPRIVKFADLEIIILRSPNQGALGSEVVKRSTGHAQTFSVLHILVAEHRGVCHYVEMQIVVHFAKEDLADGLRVSLNWSFLEILRQEVLRLKIEDRAVLHPKGHRR